MEKIEKIDKLRYEVNKDIYFEYIFSIMMIAFLLIFIIYIIVSTYGDFQLNEACKNVCSSSDGYLVSYELKGSICHCYYPNSIRNFEVKK